MTSTDFFWGIGDVFETILTIFDENIGFTAFFNWLVIIGIFLGMLYWLRHQVNFNKQADQDPNQLK